MLEGVRAFAERAGRALAGPVVRVCTWNVNSLRARLPRVLELLEKHAPDVVLLQETKVAPDQYPEAELAAAGYESVHHSGGQWAGVAILAKAGLGLQRRARRPPRRGARRRGALGRGRRPGPGRARRERLRRQRPRGREPDVRREAHVPRRARARGPPSWRGSPLIIGGDFNVAPADEDVYDPAAFAGATHVTPDERSRLAAVLEAGGLVDAYRAAPTGTHRYTWWDYRAGQLPQEPRPADRPAARLPRRSPAACRRCGIDRDLRKGQKPSDHAPLLAELAG